eukprot:tig00000197_g15693.t1
MGGNGDFDMQRPRHGALARVEMPRSAGTHGNLEVSGCLPKTDILAPPVQHIYKLVSAYESQSGVDVEQGKMCCPLDDGYPWKAVKLGGKFHCISVDDRLMGQAEPARKATADWFAQNGGKHSSYEIHTGGGSTSILDPVPEATSYDNAVSNNKMYLWGKAPHKPAIQGKYPNYGTLVNPKDPSTGLTVKQADAENVLSGELKKVVMENMAASKWISDKMNMMSATLKKDVQPLALKANWGNLTRGVGGDSDVGREWDRFSKPAGSYPEQLQKAQEAAQRVLDRIRDYEEQGKLIKGGNAGGNSGGLRVVFQVDEDSNAVAVSAYTAAEADTLGADDAAFAVDGPEADGAQGAEAAYSFEMDAAAAVEGAAAAHHEALL